MKCQSAGMCDPLQRKATHRPETVRCSSRNCCISYAARSRQTLHTRASSYTQPAVSVVKSAQKQAIRQGSMFVAPPHLLLGLFDVKPACEASLLLESAGLTAAIAEAVLIDKDLVPQTRAMSPGDLTFSPDARLALKLADEAAHAADLPAAGTPHLLLGVITCNNRTVTSLLQKVDISPAIFAEQVKTAAKHCDETAAAQPASAESQAAELVSQYQQYVQKHGSAPPQGTSGPGLGVGSKDPTARTSEDDDIYE